MHCCYTHIAHWVVSFMFSVTSGSQRDIQIQNRSSIQISTYIRRFEIILSVFVVFVLLKCQVIAIFGILDKSYQLSSFGACTQTLMYKETNKNLFYLKKTIFISQNQKFVRQEKEVQKKQNVNLIVHPQMSPVSPVFLTKVTVSIGLKNVFRVETSIPYYSRLGQTCHSCCYSSISHRLKGN